MDTGTRNNGTPRKRHVLIVDDDISLAWTFKETLESRGFDATIVPDGALALRYAQGHSLDVVVCDLQMPRLEGDLLYAAIGRSNPTLAERFVFIDGEEEHAQFYRFIDSAAVPVLHKPVEMEALMGEVLRVLAQR